MTGPAGGFISIAGERYYRIAGYDRMPPFLMNIASDTDLWMFISSNGGLTAGRVDADGALFPYETVDKLHEGHHHAGPVTLLRVERKGGEAILWEPFSGRPAEYFDIERKIYKNVTGNMVTVTPDKPWLDCSTWATPSLSRVDVFLTWSAQLLSEGF